MSVVAIETADFADLSAAEPLCVEASRLMALAGPAGLARLAEGFCPLPGDHGERRLVLRGGWAICTFQHYDGEPLVGWRVGPPGATA